jgi:hypothetical protein
MSEVMPLRFLVDEAQNIIVRETLASDSTWLLLLEQDVMLPPDAFKIINGHMMDGRYPVVSGLYFTKREMAEPLIFRGRGLGAYRDFEIGDKVWCDGVPTGCLLIHRDILQAMSDAAPEVEFRGQKARRVFETVSEVHNPGKKNHYPVFQTSDLKWCDDVLAGGYLDSYDLPHPEWPFLVDTELFCLHIDRDGITYPRTKA